MQILLIMLIVVLLAFSVLLLALAKQSPREKQTEDKEQEEYIRDYAETVRQTGGSMKKLEHWKVIAIYLIIYDMIAVNFSYFMALLVRFDFRYSSIPTDYFDAWRSFAPIYTIIILAVFGCLHLYNSVWRFASFHELIKITVATVITGVLHIVGITIFWGRMPASYYLIGIMLQFFLTVGVRFSYRFVLLERNRREKSEREERSKNVMIIGAGEAGRTIVRELQNAKETNSRVRCLIDDNPNKWGRYMEGVPVVGGRDDIFLNVDKYHMQFRYRLDKIAKIVPGGKTGQLSIYAGLKAAEDIFGVDDNIVLIHDGVRPLIGKQIISDNIESVKKYGSAVTCAPTKESVVLIDEKNNITEVVERNESRTAKAPESFYLKDILAADEEAISKGIINEIDSCTLMAHHGAKMHVVNGDYGNIKITTPEDFYTFRAIYDVKENEQLQ